MSVDYNEDTASGDEELLHGNIGEPVGCDPPPQKMISFRSKYVAKEFTVDNNDYSSLVCVIVDNYNQRTKNIPSNGKTTQRLSTLQQKLLRCGKHLNPGMLVFR